MYTLDGIPTEHPTSQPSAQPIALPTLEPSGQPTNQPSAQPSAQPNVVPTSWPSSQPTERPSCQPSTQPSVQPIAAPTSLPSSQPTERPTCQPSAQPIAFPTEAPASTSISAPLIFTGDGVATRVGQALAVSEDGSTITVSASQEVFVLAADTLDLVGSAVAISNIAGSNAITSDGSSFSVMTFSNGAPGVSAHSYAMVGGSWVPLGTARNTSNFSSSIFSRSDDGTRIAGVGSKGVIVLDFENGDWQRTAIANPSAAQNGLYDVTMSADGTRIVAVSPPQSLFTFDLIDGTWTQIVSITTVMNPTVVAISRDGTRLCLLSGPMLFSLYELVDNAWSQIASPTSPDLGRGASPLFGQHAAFSSNGKVLVVTDLGYNSNQGAAYVYLWDDTSYQPFVSVGNRRSSIYGAAQSNFGLAVSLSGDGAVLAISAPNPGVCVFFVFSIFFISLLIELISNHYIINRKCARVHA